MIPIKFLFQTTLSKNMPLQQANDKHLTIKSLLNDIKVVKVKKSHMYCLFI